MNRTRPFLSPGSGSTDPAHTRSRFTSPLRAVAAVSVVALVLAACSSSTPTGSSGVLSATGTPAPTISTAPTATPSAMVSASTSAAASASNEPTGVPTSLDPCALIPAGEASQLAGATFGAGAESTTSGNGKICTYGAQTLNVFEVVVGQAPDAATAQAEKAAAEAKIKSQAGAAGPNINFIELPTFGDGAAYTSGSLSIQGQSLSISGFYFLKGTNFVGFSDLAYGHPALTLAAMQAEATTVLGRLP